MSGTSMDGIDISLVKSNGIELKTLNKNYFYKYSNKTQNILKNILNNDIKINLNRKKFLDDFVTTEHYLAIKDLEIIEHCDLIGFHGQTIYHNAKKNMSVQLGNPKKLAHMLKRDVVFDFRSNDLKHGGEGAPLAPIYHKFMIKKLNLNLPTCVLNIGGVSNLTYWDGSVLIGFDTGPGNALMDNYMSLISENSYDRNGAFASAGIPVKKEIINFMNHEFFKKSPPKSLDRHTFLNFYQRLVDSKYSENDIMATLAEFTIESIIVGIKLLPKKIKNILVVGGGYRNHHLISRLKKQLNVTFLDETQLGLNFDYIEAELIAYLSARSIYNLPFTFPSTTGVPKPLSGGDLYNCL